MGNCFCCTEKESSNQSDVIKKTDGSWKLPYNYENILIDTDPPISLSSDKHNLSKQLRSGVFLNPGKLIKYWVDERNINCFMLFPRELSITWSNNTRYWSWTTAKESPNDTIVEVAELKSVSWLDITGKFDTSNLTPGIEYEVVFKVKLNDPNNGWDTPVNLKLVLPNSEDKPQEQKESLIKLQTSQYWVDVKVGEFKKTEDCDGDITFSMYQHDGVWKSGLSIKGVVISPKK